MLGLVSEGALVSLCIINILSFQILIFWVAKLTRTVLVMVNLDCQLDVF